MDITARPARPDDFDAVVELATEAVGLQRTKRGGEVWARTSARAADPRGSLGTEFDDPSVHTVVATLDGVVLGYGVGRVDTVADGGRLAVVTDLYVDPEARGVGLGEALMNDLLAWATGLGCFGVDSQALPGDRHTKNFFESFGLVARSLVVHRDLR